MEKQHPLILVFYLDRDLMQNKEIMVPVADHIDRTLAARDSNAIAFFIPTDGEERIECINPVVMEEVEMAKIHKIVDDLKKNFDIGQGADLNEEEDGDEE